MQQPINPSLELDEDEGEMCDIDDRLKGPALVQLSNAVDRNKSYCSDLEYNLGNEVLREGFVKQP